MTSNAPSRDVFLSHRSVDKPFVRALADQIERNSYRDRNLTVWLDEAEIRPGQSITGMVNHGLENSRFVALVMTPEYFASESGWTDAEWHAALFNDPDGRRARVIPVLAADCVVPFLLRHLGAIDLRGHNDPAEFARLLATLRGEPLPRPITLRGQLITTHTQVDRSTLIAERAVPQSDPDAVAEKLYCNLLPVEKVPRFLYSAQVKKDLLRARPDGSMAIPYKGDLKMVVRFAQDNAGVEKPFMPAFRLFEDRVLTFHDLEDADNPLAAIIDDSSIEESDVKLFSADEDNRRLLTSLLNMSLSRHLLRAGLTADDTKHQRFFFGATQDGRDRTITWVPLKKKATRTVAKKVVAPPRPSFWRHLGAYIHFVFLVNRFYVRVSPTWVITADGYKPKGGPDIGRIVSRWTSPERNLQLLYHVRFWTSVLRNRRSGPTIQVTAGDQTLEVATVPAMIQLAHGIADDRRDLLRLLDEEAPVLAAEEEELLDAAARMATDEDFEADSDLGDVIDQIQTDEAESLEAERSDDDDK